MYYYYPTETVYLDGDEIKKSLDPELLTRFLLFLLLFCGDGDLDTFVRLPARERGRLLLSAGTYLFRDSSVIITERSLRCVRPGHSTK